MLGVGGSSSLSHIFNLRPVNYAAKIVHIKRAPSSNVPLLSGASFRPNLKISCYDRFFCSQESFAQMPPETYTACNLTFRTLMKFNLFPSLLKHLSSIARHQQPLSLDSIKLEVNISTLPPR
jgi:hypothetical protein